MRPCMKDVIVGTNMLKYVEDSTAGTPKESEQREMLVTRDDDPEGPDSTQIPSTQNDDDDPEDLGPRILDRQTILRIY